MLGLISQNFRLVGISFLENELLIKVILENRDEEDIEDFLGEFCATLESNIPVEIDTTITDKMLSEADYPERLIFRRKEAF